MVPFDKVDFDVFCYFLGITNETIVIFHVAQNQLVLLVVLLAVAVANIGLVVVVVVVVVEIEIEVEGQIAFV